MIPLSEIMPSPTEGVYPFVAAKFLEVSMKKVTKIGGGYRRPVSKVSDGYRRPTSKVGGGYRR